MDRRRFLLTSLAGALAVPLAAEDTVSRQAMDIKMAREEYGLDTEALLQTQWARDNWYEGDEKEFLDFAHKQGWEPATVRNLVYDYARAMQGSMGEITDEMVADFHAGKIPAADREALVATSRAGRTVFASTASLGW
jgi:hypothetical protein